ncbi:hypothetical protein SRHO_G00186350 [Serrasalmus rhombeus]
MMEVLEEGLIAAGIIPTEGVSLESGLETAALNPGLHGSGKEPQIRSTVRIAKVGPPLSAACAADSDLTLSVDRAQIVTEQQRDSALARCRATVVNTEDFSHPFKLEVDASATGAGAVLLQEDSSGIDHPVCYYSKKFVKHQLNYSTIEKEALALLLALQHFEVYVGSSPLPLVVYTDHNPLVFLSRMRNSNQRIMRWALIIQEYNLEICYKKGSDNVLADALSRV